MEPINVTELRQHLPSYLGKVQQGEEIQVTLHGKIIARIVPVRDESAAARLRLLAIRKQCRIGDIISPSGEEWNAEHGRL
jgi:prevent-host-death family protein